MTKQVKIFIGAAIALIALIIVAIMYPATAYFNTETGTLTLMARFRRQKYPLKKYLGKTESLTMGNIIFDVDYLTPGKITYMIVLKDSGKKLLEETVSYSLADTITTQLPPATQNATGTTTAAERASCACHLN